MKSCKHGTNETVVRASMYNPVTSKFSRHGPGFSSEYGQASVYYVTRSYGASDDAPCRQVRGNRGNRGCPLCMYFVWISSLYVFFLERTGCRQISLTSLPLFTNGGVRKYIVCICTTLSSVTTVHKWGSDEIHTYLVS